jgi:tRNA1(Val) A37 N6-methylase TrmN6
MSEAGARDGAPDGLSRDAWLGGRLTLLQPTRGHRVGSDAALLAAACDPGGGRVVDVGAGVGAVGLALLALHDGLTADLVEIDPGLAALAVENAALNGLALRARVLNVDIADKKGRRAAGLAEASADLVVTNPPFFAAGTTRVSPHKARAHVFAAEGEGGSLEGWVRACLALLAPHGRFAMIHRPDALPAILSALGARLGAVALLPIHPRAGEPAHRLLVIGAKGSRAPLRIAPPLVLHGVDGRLTPEADALHRGEKRVEWGA